MKKTFTFNAENIENNKIFADLLKSNKIKDFKKLSENEKHCIIDIINLQNLVSSDSSLANYELIFDSNFKASKFSEDSITYQTASLISRDNRLKRVLHIYSSCRKNVVKMHICCSSSEVARDYFSSLNNANIKTSKKTTVLYSNDFNECFDNILLALSVLNNVDSTYNVLRNK